MKRNIKKIGLYIALLCCLSNLSAQENNDIVIGKELSIYSKILNEERTLWIHAPSDFEGSIYEKKSYPVLYLLDGAANFDSVVGLVQHLSTANGNALIPQVIVVGITNTNRSRDLTPTKGEAGHPYTNSEMIEQSGGGADFMAFIEKELIPYVDANYPTEPYRMFIGHSFGGLTVVNTFIHQPELFSSYVAIDPSMWWSDHQLLGEIEDAKFDERYNDKSCFVAIANTMSVGMDTIKVKSDTTMGTEHIRSILKLNTLLNKKASSQVDYQGKYYDQDGHGSVPLIAEYDALRHIFKFYTMPFEQEDFVDPNSDLLAKVQKHFEQVSRKYGSEQKPDEAFVNGLGYEFMGMEQFEKAEAFFKLNVTNYPNSFNVFDSLGDYYVAVGKKKKAIENFKKSIELNADSYSKEKLEALLKE